MCQHSVNRVTIMLTILITVPGVFDHRMSVLGHSCLHFASGTILRQDDNGNVSDHVSTASTL